MMDCLYRLSGSLEFPDMATTMQNVSCNNVCFSHYLLDPLMIFTSCTLPWVHSEHTFGVCRMCNAICKQVMLSFM